MGTSCHAVGFPVVCTTLFRDSLVSFTRRVSSEITTTIQYTCSGQTARQIRTTIYLNGISRYQGRNYTSPETQSTEFARALGRFSLSFRLKRLLDFCPLLQHKRYVRRWPLVEWTDHSGRIILMGEAAHPSVVRSYAFSSVGHT